MSRRENFIGFQLNFLGVGQHVMLSPKPTIEETIRQMEGVFQEPSSEVSPLPTGLHYDKDTNWIIGLDFTVLDYIRMKALFLDPGQYGIVVSLSSSKAGDLEGLELEILYEKISRSLGAYKGRLALPSKFKRMDYGSFVLITPEIYVELYTNGDFNVDIGFPQHLDFSRSLSIEAFPYTGGGGFYIGKLSEQASSRRNIPRNSTSVTEFGIGMRLGVGKTIEQGIFKAGLNLTIMGIVEGVIATKPGGFVLSSDDKNYWLKGVLGVAGELYGEVDFSVVTAAVRFDVKAPAEVIFETNQDTPVKVSVDVSAEAEIKVDFKVAKGKVKKSFHTKLSTDFVIENKNSLRLEVPQATLDWHRIIPRQPIEIGLFTIPHISVCDDVNGKRVLNYTVMTYIGSEGQTDPSFKELVRGILIWSINAYLKRTNPSSSSNLEDVLNLDVRLDDLVQLMKYLVGDKSTGQTIIEYGNSDEKDILTFMNHYFSIKMFYPEQQDGTNCGESDQELELCYFPMIPDMTLEATLYKGDGSEKVLHPKIDFRRDNPRDPDYLKAIKDYIRSMLPDFKTSAEEEHDLASYRKAQYSQSPQTFAVHFTQDYVTMIARESTTAALAWMVQSRKNSIKLGELVADNMVMTKKMVQDIAGMASRYCLFGMTVPGPENTAFKKGTPLYPIYQLIGQQFTVPMLQANDKILIRMSNVRNPSPALSVDFYPYPDVAGQGKPDVAIDVPQCELERFRDLQRIELKDEYKNVSSMVSYRDVREKYSFKAHLIWNTDKWILPFSEPLMRKQYLADPPIEVDLMIYNKKEKTCQSVDPSRYQLATKLEVEIRRGHVVPGISDHDNEAIYEVIGTDEGSQRLLEKLYSSMTQESNASIQSIQLLYSTKGVDGLQSEDGAEVFLFRTNLSNFGKPPALTKSLKEDIHKQQWIIRYLLQSSIVRFDGFFLAYCKDNKGLPKEVFDGEDSARVTIFIEYESNQQLQSYMNSVIWIPSSDMNEYELYFEEQSESVRLSAIPEGHVGIEVIRKSSEGATYLESYLKDQFNLIGFTLEGSSEGYATIPAQNQAALPVSAHKEENSEKHYAFVVPVSRFHKDYEFNTLRGPVVSNPYAGAGESVQIRLHLQDGFGNRLAQPEFLKSLPLYLRSPMIPIHQWPGIELQYDFIKDQGGIHLKLTIRLQEELYSSVNDPKGEGARLALVCYQKILIQMAQDGVDVFLDTSLAPQSYNMDKAGLLHYINQCIAFFEAVIIDPQQGAIHVDLLTYSYPVVLDQSDTIFELTVSLVIKRTDRMDDLIDPAFSHVKEVREGMSMILPSALKGKHTNNNHPLEQPTLQAFAQSFEEYFQAKLATGSSRNKGCKQGMDKALWVVQLQKLQIQIDHKSYAFSPALNAKRKLKATFNLQTYDGLPELEHHQVLDVNLLAKECLQLTDKLLECRYAELAYRVDDGITFEKIMDCKRTLAEIIASSLEHTGVLNPDYPDNSNHAEAQERFKQQLRYKLSDAYETDAIVQHMVTTTMPVVQEKIAPRLYGQMTTVGEQQREYVFSDAKIPLQGTSTYLTYLFDTKKPKDYEIQQWDQLVFRISHVEHDIQDLPSMEGYQTASWLALIIPYDVAINSGNNEKPSIPIIIKECPGSSPSLPVHWHEHQEQASTLKQARLWKYKYNYEMVEMMSIQDRIKVKIILDFPSNLTEDDPFQEFAHALAQFRLSCLGIKAVLDGLLNPQGCQTSQAKIPIEFLLTSLTLLTDKWRWWVSQAAISDEGLSSTVLQYEIQEMPDKDGDHDSPLVISISENTRSKINIEYPVITIDGYVTETVTTGMYKFLNKQDLDNGRRVYLIFKDRGKKEHLKKTVHLDNIDIIQYRTAWAETQLTRNEGIFDTGMSKFYMKTNPKFVFESMAVKFGSPLEPLLIHRKPMNIAELDGSQTIMPLNQHINRLFEHVLEGRLQKGHALKGWVKYRFPLFEGTPDIYSVNVPSNLLVQFEYDSDTQTGKDIVDALTAKVLDKFKKKDGPRPTVGTLVFELGMFESRVTKRPPILKLKDLYLDVDYIQELVEQSKP
ncbi:hypothetical protein AMS62_26335 [Bacillus sp. FJAT-18019]|nr:hypothetical protein AMS62_26335 [Bacillus sp. FJAT-18019]